MGTNRMGQGLAKTGRGTQGVDAQSELPLDDVSLRREREKTEKRAKLDKEAATWLDAAAGAYGQAKELACDLELTEQYFSDMCGGLRSTPLRTLIVVKRNRKALVAFLDAFLDGTELTVTQKRKVSRRQAETSTARAARSIAALWPVIRQLAAEDAHTDEEDLESALNADSDADAIAK